ncbi:hypothetical protein [uncultured Neptuniibacter sp.]|uniref:hypothetical protein n=1 Tax=uncultured Neptuniibacter sp. TaxID=502143 RepID=UPI0026329937|nr:hypothetical protein [uncultured Neptuniibacter sp.]
MEEHEHIDRVKSKLWKYSLLCAASFMPPIIAISMPFYLVSPYLSENETLSTWFQRSGSLMVIIAIITEFKLYSLNDYFDLNNTRMFVPVDLPKTYKSTYFVISIVALMSMLIGTLIWGYGDIFV